MVNFRKGIIYDERVEKELNRMGFNPTIFSSQVSVVTLAWDAFCVVAGYCQQRAVVFRQEGHKIP